MKRTRRDISTDAPQSRRRFLATAAGALAAAFAPGALFAPSRASAQWVGQQTAQSQSPENEFVFSRFNYKMGANIANNWDYGGEFDENFLTYLRKATNVPVSLKSFGQRTVQAAHEESFLKSPFWFMIGDGDFRLTSDERDVLAEFFKRGGFLWGDDCVNEGGEVDVFWKAFARELPRVLPKAQFKAVPPDSAMYSCFYQIPGGTSPYYKGGRHPDMGLFRDERMVAFLTPGDVHCAWRMDRPKYPGLQQAAFRMGVNVVVYALTH